MRTATYTGERTIEVMDANPSPPAEQEVRIRVAYTGLCGTDLHILHGSHGSRVARPLSSDTRCAASSRPRPGRDRLDRGRRRHGDAPGLGRHLPACLPATRTSARTWTSSASTHPVPRRSSGTCPPGLLVRSPRDYSQEPPSPSPSPSPCTTSADRSWAGRQGRRHRRRPDRRSDRHGGPPLRGRVVVIEPDPGRAALIAALGSTTLDPPRSTRSPGWRSGPGRRRRRRLRSVGRRRGESAAGSPHWPRFAGRSSWSRSIPRRANRPPATLLARTAILGARVYQRRTSRRPSSCSPTASSPPSDDHLRRSRSTASPRCDRRARERPRDEGSGRVRIRPHERLFDLDGRTRRRHRRSRGIGFAMAEALAAAGADIIGVSANLGSRHSEIENGRERPGTRVRAAGLRLLRPGSRPEPSDRTTRANARIDILINNAGTIQRAPAAEHPLATGGTKSPRQPDEPVRLTQAIARGMLERGRGKSRLHRLAAVLPGRRNVPGYAAAKSGVAGLTQALANEWTSRGVTVNAIAPATSHRQHAGAARRSRPLRDPFSSGSRPDAGGSPTTWPARRCSSHRRPPTMSPGSFCPSTAAGSADDIRQPRCHPCNGGNAGLERMMYSLSSLHSAGPGGQGRS